MSLTFEIPPELEARVRTIPDLDERFVAFLRNALEHEEWRNKRYSERARRLLSEGMADAERLKAAGISEEETSQRLQAVLDRIAPKD